MKRLSRLFAGLILLLSILSLYDPKAHLGPVLATVTRYLRLLAGAISPFSALFGVLSVFAGLLSQDLFSILSGAITSLFSAAHIKSVTASHGGFDEAFGPRGGAANSIKPAYYLPNRRWLLRKKYVPSPQVESDLPFYTDPRNGRQLICDIWKPSPHINPSGMAFIYFHGGGWYSLHKGLLTRTLFQQLAAHGHLVVDASYRLFPEVKMSEMLSDVKRAIAWLKTNASLFDINPERVVVGGGSAGGHLALLAAYSAHRSDLTPPDLIEIDTSVRGAVAYYPPVNIAAYYNYGYQNSISFGPLTVPGRQEVVSMLMGGSPQEVPETYSLFSPSSHVSSSCPPTLIFAPEMDDLVPIEPIYELHRSLVDAGVPSVMVNFPYCEHGFDLVLPQYSPSAQAALNDLHHFLALLSEVV